VGQAIQYFSSPHGNRIKALLGISLTGILHPLCFPHFNLGLIAWIVLIPLQLVIHNSPPRRALWQGWLAGTIAFVGTVPWVITAMNQFGQVPLVVSTLLMLLLASYLGLYIGIYAWGYARLLQQYPSLLWFGAPALWVTLEYVRTYAFSGFPWALLGYSQYHWLPLIQFSDITGVYGVSFLVVMGNVVISSLLLWVWHHRMKNPVRSPWLSGVTFLVILSVVLAYGHWQIDRQDTFDRSAKTLSIGLVQPNIAQDQKWDETYREETLSRYATLSQQAGQNTAFLIWPEAATPFFYEREPLYQEKIVEMVRNFKSPLLFGSPALRFHQDGKPYLLNSAYVLTPEGTISDRYDKRHLVPFGEYIPLKSLLFFLHKLVVGIGDFKSGQGPMTMRLPTDDKNTGPRFGAAICFEVIFPDLVRQMAKEGANFLVTITNDAWFGKSTAPYQHFGMVVFRAVENHLAFARAANTGISGIIAPDGRILMETEIFSQQAVTGSLPLRSSSPTFYTSYGDVFSWGCVILTGVWFSLCWFSARTSKHQ
jgi:apolipoprotein N-acyltransferase